MQNGRPNSEKYGISRALFFLAALLVFSQAAFAVCPGTITEDYNMSGSESQASTCFVLAAENITLDCAGNSITLTGSANMPAVDVTAVNTTIKNCVIVENGGTNRAYGAVYIRSTANGTNLQDTNITSAGHYSLQVESQNNLISRVRTTSTQNQFGVYFASSSNNVLTDMVINKTGTANTYSLYWNVGDNNTFDRVTVDANAGSTNLYGSYLNGFTNGLLNNSHFKGSNTYNSLYLVGGSSGNVVNNATVRSSAATANGIYIDLSPNNAIVNSDIYTTGVGIYIVSSSGGTIMENDSITSTASAGIYINPAVASDGNVINNVNVTAYTYALFFSPSSYNTVTNSSFNSTASYAFYSDTGSSYDVFSGNVFESRQSGGNAYAMYFVSDSSSNLIEDNIIDSPTYYALYFGINSYYNNINRNTIRARAGNGYGVTFAGIPASYNNVTDNNILSHSIGVQITGDSNNVSGNNITSATTYGIYLYLSNNNVLDNNNVYATTYGIYLYSSTYNNITNSYYNSSTFSPVYLATSADNNRFVNNTFNQTNAATSANYRTIYIVTSSSNVFIDNNILTGGGNGVDISTSATNNEFHNNSIYTNGLNMYGVRITTNCQNNKFLGNNITSNRGYGASITTSSNRNVFSGGYIKGYTQTGLYILGSSTGNNISNMNISSGIGAAGAQALYITSASGNKFWNVNFSANGSYGGYLYNVVSQTTFENVSFRSASSYGLYMLQNVQGNSFSGFSVTTGNNYGLYLNGNGNLVAYNNFTDGTIEASNAGGYVTYLAAGSNSNQFTNVSITNYVYRALYLLTAANNVFTGCNITAANAVNAIGVLAQTLSTGNVIANSTISAPGSSGAYDVYIGNSAIQASTLTLINSTFTQDFSFGDASSYINISWYLRANVFDLTGLTPVEGASVNFTNVYGTKVASMITNQDGLTPFAEVQEYRWTSAGSGMPFRPYNISVSIGSVYASKASNPTSVGPLTENVNINATVCGALSSNYTLTNNVYGSANCFTAGASGITLNCNGYIVNYSRTSAGCGLVGASFVGLKVNNCRFVQGNASSVNSAAVCLSGNSEAFVSNSTISSKGAGNGYDFTLFSSNATALNVTMGSGNSNLTGSAVLLKQWYLSANLTDLAGNPLLYSNLNATDAFNWTRNYSLDSGYLPKTPFTQYAQTAVATSYYTNYTLIGWAGNATGEATLNLTSNANVVIPLNASTCGQVASSITLKNNIYSPANCLVAAAHTVTVDCAGYAINYSRSGDGYFGINTAGYDNILMKNCHFVQGNDSANSSYAIFANNSTNFRIYNSSIAGRASYLNQTPLARFINTYFNNSTVSFEDTGSVLKSLQYAYIHTIGLAGENVNSSPINVTDVFGTPTENGTTDDNGTLTLLLTQFVQNYAGVTSYDPYNFTATHPGTGTSNTTQVAMNESRNVTINLISAGISILSPNQSQIFIQGDPFQGGPVNILVNETLGQDWLQNVTVQVSGDPYNLTYQAEETYPGSNLWEYNYTIDLAQQAATLTIIARGWNGNTSVQTTREFVVTRSSGAGVAEPVISYFCPDHTYLVENQTANISIAADLDTVLYGISINITRPDNTSFAPSPNSSLSGPNYTYNRTWSITANQTGTYQLYTEAIDVNANRVNSTKYIYVAAANATINLSANGVDTLELLDVCSNMIIASGTSLEGVIVAPGNYTLVAEDLTRSRILFYQYGAESHNGTFLDYARASAASLAPPANRRNIFLMSASVLGGRFETIQTIMNYSQDEGTLVAENSLDAYSCQSYSNCTWSQLNYTLYTASNLIDFSIANLSGLYGIFEPAYPEPQIVNVTQIVTQTETSTNIVTKEVEVEVPVIENVEVLIEVPVEVPIYVSVRILSGPAGAEMHPGDTITVEIGVANTAATDLGQISVSVEPSGDIEASLSKNGFSLPIGASEKAILTIKSKGSEGTYSVKLTADAPNVKTSDTFTLPVVVSSLIEKDKLAVKERIDFAYQLLSDNPECLDLRESLASASLYLTNGLYVEADAGAQKAISACSGMVALRGKPVVQKEVVPSVDWTLTLMIPVVLGGAAAAMVLFSYMFIRMFGGKKHRHEHPHRGEAQEAQVEAPESPK